jgi:hypothetical protein
LGGIFSLLTGILSVLGGLGMAFFFTWFFRFLMEVEEFDTGVDPMGEGVLDLISLIYGGLGIFYALIGVLAIVGGVYALKRRNWGLALTGAIAANFVFMPFGVVAVIFTTLAKSEFVTKVQPLPFVQPPTFQSVPPGEGNP